MQPKQSPSSSPKTRPTPPISPPPPQDADRLGRIPVDVTLGTHRNFTIKLTGELSAASETSGYGTLSVSSRASSGADVAVYSTEPQALSPIATRQIRNILEDRRNPRAALTKCLSLLSTKEGIPLRLELPLPAPVPAPGIPGAHLAPLDIEELASSPSHVDYRLRAVSKPDPKALEPGVSPHSPFELLECTLQVDVFPREGVLTATFLAPRQDGTHELEPLQRFRVESKDSISTPETALKEGLMRATRGLFDIFLQEGALEAISALERGLFPAEVLPPTRAETEAEHTYLSNGVVQGRNYQERTVPSTGTRVALVTSESIAAIRLEPAEWARNFQLSSVVTFESPSSDQPLNAASLRYSRQVFSLLSSDEPAKRRAGLDMITAEEVGRVRALEQEEGPREASTNISPLKDDLCLTTIRALRGDPFVYSLVHSRLMSATRGLGIGVRVSSSNEPHNLLDLVEGRVSRHYSLGDSRHEGDLASFSRLCVTQRLDGAMWAHATSRFGGALQGRLLELEGASPEERLDLEVELLRSMAQQPTLGPFHFQARFIRAMNSQCDPGDLEARSQLGTLEEQGLWDGTLSNVPPTTDRAACDALRYAQKICDRITHPFNDKDEFASCSYIGQGRVQLSLLIGGPQARLAITLQGKKLLRVSLEFKRATGADPSGNPYEAVRALAAPTPIALNAEQLLKLQLASKDLISYDSALESAGDFARLLEEGNPLIPILVSQLRLVEVPTSF